MAYVKQDWVNRHEAEPTPITAERLDYMEEGIETAHELIEAVSVIPGPQGPAGPIGPQGIQGPQGEHAVRYYGVGPPPTAIIGAKPGDEYLDSVTGDLYILG